MKKLLIYPNQYLKRIAPTQRVPIHSSVIRKMKDVFLSVKAAGLAANQIGLPHRVIIWEHELMVNPIIRTMKDPLESLESCLSLPGQQFLIRRMNKIHVCWLSPDLQIMYDTDLSGLDACIVQHEIDHLNGILINEKVLQTS